MLPWPNPGAFSALLRAAPPPPQWNKVVCLFLLTDEKALSGEGPGLLRGSLVCGWCPWWWSGKGAVFQGPTRLNGAVSWHRVGFLPRLQRCVFSLRGRPAFARGERGLSHVEDTFVH